MNNCPDCNSEVGYELTLKYEIPDSDEEEYIGFYYCIKCDWQGEIG